MTSSANGIARHWRLKSQRYSLTGQTCRDCNTLSFPPRDICPVCNEATDPVFQFSTSSNKEAAPTSINVSFFVAEKQLEAVAV